MAVIVTICLSCSYDAFSSIYSGKLLAQVDRNLYLYEIVLCPIPIKVYSKKEHGRLYMMDVTVCMWNWKQSRSPNPYKIQQLVRNVWLLWSCSWHVARYMEKHRSHDPARSRSSLHHYIFSIYYTHYARLTKFYICAAFLRARITCKARTIPCIIYLALNCQKDLAVPWCAAVVGHFCRIVPHGYATFHKPHLMVLESPRLPSSQFVHSALDLLVILFTFTLIIHL